MQTLIIVSANLGYRDLDCESLDTKRSHGVADASDNIVDIREYDVPYHVRVAIDRGIRIGKWYRVEVKQGITNLTCIEERIQRADPVVLAYDIETTKSPLKFPDAVIDQIMMISYMIDGQGFLITNREIVSEEISDFEYTPRPEYQGEFLIFNEPDERAVVERFFLHIKEARPTVIATFNGDFFDWPFVEARASVLGIDMYQEIGFRKNNEDIYESNYGVHMDCFAWVNRDSYLPQGSRGLKAVTVAKLGYDPDELDPELMTRYASEQPQILAEYSVSDAVATYYLYMKYIHPFIFSLCNIIPLNPDDVLRKGTGTLCEMLLMVQAYEKGIVLPNKHKEPKETFWQGHLLESETYVGGHVESIEAGVFRSDIPVNFAIDPSAIDELIEDLDGALRFSILVEEKKKLEDIVNYDNVKAEITAKLQNLKMTPNRKEKPSIYHLDVASMYPNIMTTNRLQPDSMIDEADCAACDFNLPGKTCDRRMPWAWRGEFLPALKNEYNMVRHAVENERFPGKWPKGPSVTFQDMSSEEQAAIVKKRLIDYSKKIYHKIHETKTIEREAIICQRENPFYVDTVKDFRDRRYDYKGKQKQWKSNTEALKSSGATQAEIEEGKKMIVLYDSLQLAHKVILNSFYGYVMRKGSRWYSMEMAGVTCLTGAHIIQMARELVERVGRPLELDTDGIWCMLPSSFPENVSFQLKNGKSFIISFPCVMLNHLVHAKFTNHQYQDLVDAKTFRYETHSDNTIFFEVDGPYRAMILPTSKEEDKNLKKRYAVFNHDGSLAELKGFEVKRRGELKLIKIFQTQIFKFFLDGTTLAETYDSVAKVANRWLDVLHQHGSSLVDEELIDLICENRSMSKALQEYGAQKSTSITTARRLAEFLGVQMVKDKGLNCKYIIAAKPRNAPVTERAIPVAIFSADDTIKRYFLRKWLKEDPSDMNPRTLIDWDYYLERLGSVIQKLITIPAALQKIRNPVPRVGHPEWLQRRINIKDDRYKQRKMTDSFEKQPLKEITSNALDHRLPLDLEDFGASQLLKAKRENAMKTVQKRKALETSATSENTNHFVNICPSLPIATDNYRAFLDYQKKKWKIQKQQRLRRRQLFGERNNGRSDTLRHLFDNQAQALMSHTWQILQIRESETPGHLRVFVLVGQKVRALIVKVPRQIYLNLKADDLPDVDIEGCKVEKVTHALPNGHPSIHLFKLVMAEDIYLRESQKLALLFNHHSIEGVYEQQVPLTLRAMLHLGNLCTFDSGQEGVLGKGIDWGFDLSSLKRLSTQEPYLLSANVAFLSLILLTIDDVQVLGLFSTLKEEAEIFVFSCSSYRAELPTAKAEETYHDLFTKRANESITEPWQAVFQYPSSLRMKVKHFRTKRKFHLGIADAVRKIHNREDQRPTIVIVQTPPGGRLLDEVPSLNDRPVLILDSLPPEGKMIGWERIAVRRLVTHYLAVGPRVSDIVELARYGDVPLCNLETDDPRFLIDIAYARRLQKNDVILWWSKGTLPDHAGYEKDDILRPIETVSMPAVNIPGAYSSVCIEIDVRNLAINTLLTSSLINELEGADCVAFNPALPTQEEQENGTTMIHSDDAFASAGITALRDMVKAWWTEACRGSTMADVMVQHLVRWIESPDSFLYDRSLNYYVKMMSKKAFQQLMTDFKRVGSNVVFASSNRLLLQTTKSEVGNAYAYTQYILKSIKAKPLFHFLDLDIKEYWSYLVWYDEFNYGGKACQDVVEVSDQHLDTTMHWQLSTFLPLQYQPIFRDWVVAFIELMHNVKRPRHMPTDEESSFLPQGIQSPFRPLTQTSASINTHLTSILTNTISKPLKRQVLKMISRHRSEVAHADLAEDHLYPDLPGSHLDFGNTHPVLQLVKSIMHVYSLDGTVGLEARYLRKELLALFEIKEFSPHGRFQNPSSSLRLEQLICEHCTTARDLDLCRDEDILPSADASATGSTTTWTCSACHYEYNRRKIEEMLISRINQVLVKWQTQDLKCNKCGRLRVNDFMEHCGCSGVWISTVNKGKIMEDLRVLEKVGSWYGLVMLKEIATGVLSSI